MISKLIVFVSLLFSFPAIAQAQQAPAGPDPMFQLVFFVGLFVFFANEGNFNQGCGKSKKILLLSRCVGL